MQMQRITMPKGHQALCLEGHEYLPDDAGAFMVPAAHVPELMRVHGAQLTPNAADFIRQADALEARARIAQKQADDLKEEAQSARKRAQAEQEREKKAADERMRAQAEADAVAKAAESEAAKKKGSGK